LRLINQTPTNQNVGVRFIEPSRLDESSEKVKKFGGQGCPLYEISMG